MCLRVEAEDPTGIGIEEECKRGQFGHLFEGFCEESVEGVRLLVVDGDGKCANMGGSLRTGGEGAEDG